MAISNFIMGINESKKIYKGEKIIQTIKQRLTELYKYKELRLDWVKQYVIDQYDDFWTQLLNEALG